MRFSNRSIKALSTNKDTKYRVWDKGGLTGLYLMVMPTGTKTFRYFYRLNGQSQDIKIGRYPTLSIDEARNIAKGYAAQVANRVSPIEEKNKAALQAKLNENAIFGEYLKNQYAPWVRATKKSANETLRMLGTDFKHLHRRRLKEVTKQDAINWIINARNGTGYKRPLTNSTINRRIAALKGLFTHAVSEGYISSNPLSGVKNQKIDNNAKERILSTEEHRALFDVITKRDRIIGDERQRTNEWRAARNMEPLPSYKLINNYIFPLISLMLYTGIRRNEAFSLHWDDIDFHGKILTVRGDVAKSSQTRRIPLAMEVLSLLKSWKDEHKSENPLVFPSPSTGKKLTTIKTAWNNIIKEAAQKCPSISDLNLHALRHTFATNLMSKGVHIMVLQSLLGHQDIKTTQRYVHVQDTDREQAIRAISHWGYEEENDA